MPALVTVVIPFAPSYTPSELLLEAIESVQQQSVPTDIIVIEDADEQGPGWARNRGLTQASTRYVAFLDADDIWQPDKLSRQLSRLKDTGAGICVEGPSMDTEEFIRAQLLSTLDCSTSSFLLDTSRVDIRFDEDLRRREDHLFAIEAAHKSDICFCENITTTRKHESGLSNTTDGVTAVQQDEIFIKRVVDRVPIAEEYAEEFWMDLYFSRGRELHFQGKHRDALREFSHSLAIGFYPKSAVFCLLTLLYYILPIPIPHFRDELSLLRDYIR